MEVRRVLVPVRGTQADDWALELAVSLARKKGAHILVVYVVEVSRSLPLDVQISAEVRQGNQVLDRVQGLANDLDYEVEADLLQAREVGPALVDEAVEKGVDLIILGVPYKRRFGEFSVGRVAPYLLKNAPCRVLLVREPQP